MTQALAADEEDDRQRETLADALLAWYDRHHRHLPWRLPPQATRQGHRPDPYRVWLSEIMLQQTTVGAVKPYCERFLERWPTVEALARADLQEVMKAWAGLGYYSRARNLKKCAEEVAHRHGGVFPDTEAGLKALPGIGDYTAAAVAAIAFGRRAAVVDGNVITVGITDFAQDQLGDVVFVELPSVGDLVVQFEKMGEIESVKAVSDLYSPIDGCVVEVNDELAEKPELVNTGPFDGGWLIRVEAQDVSQIDGLLSADAYEAFTSGSA